MEKTLKFINTTVKKILASDSEDDEEAEYDRADDLVRHHNLGVVSLVDNPVTDY